MSKRTNKNKSLSQLTRQKATETRLGHQHLLFLVNCGKRVRIGIVRSPTSRAKPIQVLTDVMPAPHTNAVPTRARIEVLVRQIHLLYTQWTHLGFFRTFSHPFHLQDFRRLSPLTKTLFYFKISWDRWCLAIDCPRKIQLRIHQSLVRNQLFTNRPNFSGHPNFCTNISANGFLTEYTLSSLDFIFSFDFCFTCYFLKRFLLFKL